MAFWNSERKWNLIYLLSAGWGVIFWVAILQDIRWSVVATISLAIIKELGDEAYKAGWFGTPHSTHPFWDIRGFSASDILFAAFGSFIMSGVILYGIL